MLSKLVAGDEPKSIIADIGFTSLRVAVGLMMAVGHGLAKVPPAEGFVDAVGSLGVAFLLAGSGRFGLDFLLRGKRQDRDPQ